MKMGDVYNSFSGKTILVTGVTGFLGKVFVEKILRCQPEIKKLYLLVRSSNTHLATKRLHFEVFKNDLFRVQRAKRGAGFDSFISEKVVAVAGDVSLDMLGIKDVKMNEEMLNEINIIVHSAATTRFDERFNNAMATNTMGALNVLNYSKNCRKLEILLSVSTAYVCGQGKGLIIEKPLNMGWTPNGSSKLDIESEKKLIDEKLSELQAQNANEETIKLVMKKFGMERANLHGWPNTYTFTKAMGEMILTNMKDNLPLIIIRPTIVSGTYSEPFSGWIQEVRGVDYMVNGYGNGTMKSFVGHQDTILDLIPVDMVVNSMIIAMVAHSMNICKSLVYQIGSSLRNPLKMSNLVDDMYIYFTKHPWLNEKGKQVLVNKKLTLFSTSMDEFDPNKGSILETKMAILRPYAVFECIFDDKNVEKLRMVARRVANEGYNFDPKSINWKDYMMNVHIPTIMKLSMQSKM